LHSFDGIDTTITSAVVLTAPEQRAVLSELRQHRRARRIEDFDIFEAFYRVYVTAIVSAVAVWVLSGVIGDQRAGPVDVARVREHGAQVVGALVGLAWAVGLRSGGRGGPLVIEAAEVRHVHMAPLDRSLTLRGPAVRQLRFGVLAGMGVGAVAGLLAFRRLPGHAAVWVAVGAMVGGLVTAGALGLALIVSGRRLGRWVGSGLAVAVVVWSALDLAFGTVTSPASFLGQAALWPMKWQPSGLVGVLVVPVIVAAGLAVVGGCSLEAAERRATLAGQLRFAATLRDLRTVVVLRRQLSQELPRERPWTALPRWPAAAGWRRGWQCLLRFPVLRLVRLVVLGVAAGAALAGAWRGTTPLVVAAGVALYVAGLDALEPMGQELDHPERRDSYPRPAGSLYLSELGPPLVLMGAVGLMAGGVMAAVIGSGSAVGAGLMIGVLAAWSGLAGAVITVIQGPPPLFSPAGSLMPPEIAGARAVVRLVWPLLVATAGALPVLAARPRGQEHNPAAVVGGLAIPVLALLGVVGIWVRYHEEIHEWFRSVIPDASGRRPMAS
jgi:hypothetical protein